MRSIVFTVILTTFCTVTKYGYAQSNKCGIEKFQCQNGECIASELLCDGRPDCLDQSDETQAECTKPEIMCPDYAFRCAYGACVDGDATCNGVKDCIDNSDETLLRCRGINVTGNVAECSSNQFKCDNGQCIDSTALCDGAVDCTDSSDETYTKCGSFNCPQTVFRCAYGACIDGDLKCNGVRNCADGSDEDPKLCNVSDTTSTPVTSHTPIYTPTTSWTPKPRRACTVPQQPQNGHWKLHKSQCANGQDCDLDQGTQLDPGAYLIYSCNSGYKLRGSSDVFCGPEGKWLNIPVCIEVRCKPLSSVSTDALCTYNNKWVSCESPVLPLTSAKLTCRNSYRQDSSFLTTERSQVLCNENGQWEPDPIRCIPVCGLTSPNIKPLIVNGTRPSIAEFPWHATLYRVERPDDPKEFICGATIIQENLLITAAHCVFDEARKQLFPAEKLFVATGNLFLDYDSALHDQSIVKKAKVKDVHIACNYIGLEGNYAWDIAIIELETPFVFSSLLLPACIDPFTQSDQTVLEVGNYGKVAGFGKTHHGTSSAILQSLSVPYVPLSQCKSLSVVYETEKYITIDKFCAGYTNGSTVCDGDSGGGLVFQTGDLWYLRGIVSVGLGSRVQTGARTCEGTYSLYTRISSHIGWIQDVMLQLQIYKSYPPCSSRN